MVMFLQADDRQLMRPVQQVRIGMGIQNLGVLVDSPMQQIDFFWILADPGGEFHSRQVGLLLPLRFEIEVKEMDFQT